jgi:chromate transport protein ChrA
VIAAIALPLSGLYVLVHHLNVSDRHLNVLSLLLGFLAGLMLIDTLMRELRRVYSFLIPGAVLLTVIALASVLLGKSLTNPGLVTSVLLAAGSALGAILTQAVWDKWGRHGRRARHTTSVEAEQDAERRWTNGTLATALLLLFLVLFIQIRLQLAPDLSHPPRSGWLIFM